MKTLMTGIAMAAALAVLPAHAQTNPPADSKSPTITTEPSNPANPPAVKATPSASTATDTTSATKGMMMTDADAKAWINKVVYSSDGKNVGEVSEIIRDNAGNVTELHADIGGFLGLGETRVSVKPSEFKLASDRVILNVPADQAKSLPHLQK